jgi:hypothetical protein
VDFVETGEAEVGVAVTIGGVVLVSKTKAKIIASAPTKGRV